MASSRQYRVAGIGGVTVLVSLAFFIANYTVVQILTTDAIPIFSRLEPKMLTGVHALIVGAICVSTFVFALAPLYKPQPRQRLDTLAYATRRSLAAVFALATIGYFDYTYRLPRATLIVLGGLLIVLLPTWFLTIRVRPGEELEPAVVVGDNAEEIHDIIEVADVPLLGFVSPPSAYQVKSDTLPAIADGGSPAPLTCLGSLDEFANILDDYDVDTAIFAFEEPTRGEFFGALADCHNHDVTAKVHRNHTDSVLTAPGAQGDLVGVDLEPWDWQERLVKRVFDICFAGFGLVVFSPLMLIIAVAIKLDSSGPVFYKQERTAEFGKMFTIYKFRSMLPESEDANPGEDDSRITRVGAFLRRTHLDELPQLWSIFSGDMSVVGPRAVWTDEESLLEEEVAAWRKRWFVKPGLTGLAQINGISSENPEAKIRYDLKYIREQGFWADIKIIIRQVWLVVNDFAATFVDRLNK